MSVENAGTENENEKNVVYTCEFCGKKFEDEIQFAGHTQTHVKRGDEKGARRKRIPLGTPHLRMDVEKRPGKKLRWINDTRDRVMRAIQGGYVPVKDPNKSIKVGDGPESGNTDLGTSISQVVGSTDSGESIRGFLMEIDEEFYKEDQDYKQRAVDETEKVIRRGEFETEDMEGKQYVPKGGIKMGTSKRPDRL